MKVKIPKLHKGQQQIIDNKNRFNVVVCGRRFGKTTLAEHLVGRNISKRIGVFMPTYKDLSKFWRAIKERLRYVIVEKNEQLKELYLITGGSIDFWSSENPDSGRGREYDLVIIDETQKHRNLNYFWQNTLFPTLTKTKGEAWFFGTIDTPNSAFYKLHKTALKSEYWMAFTAETRDNPFIPKEEIEIAKNTLDDITFRREYKAEWVASNDGMKFVTTTYRKEYRPISDVGYIILSFDNNYNPLVCQVIHCNYDFTEVNFYATIKQYNTDIHTFLPYLELKLNELIPNFNVRSFIITGDPNANQKNVYSKGNISMFQSILDYFRLSESQFELVSHISHDNHRTKFNNTLFSHPNIVVNPSNTDLIFDFDNVKMKEVWNGEKKSLKIDKDRRTTSAEADSLDCARYFMQAFLYEIYG